MSGGDGKSEGNTGLGHNGGTSSGNINGSSDSGSSVGGGGWGWDHSAPNTTTGPGGEVRVNLEGKSNSSAPGRPPNGGNDNGGKDIIIDPANPNYSSLGLSISHGQPGYWGYNLIASDESINYYLKIFVPYGDSQASLAAKASQELLNAEQAEEAAKKAAQNATGEDKTAAEQAAKDAEEARQKAELEQLKLERLTAAARVFSQDIQSVRGVPVAPAAASSPLSFSLAGLGGISFTGTPASVIATRIAAAITTLSEIATVSMIGPVVAAISTLLYSPSLNSGENINIGRDVSALIPGDLLGLPDASELETAAKTNTPVPMPIRGALDVDEENQLTVGLVKSPIVGTVKVVKAIKDEQTGYYSYTLPDEYGIPRQSILISPADAPGVNGPTSLSGPVPLPENIITTGDYDGEREFLTDSVLPNPWPSDYDYNDVILIFPADSGLRPLYVMYRSRRNSPGTVNGEGKTIGDNWLDSAGTGEGAAIPKQIADKLRGKTYSSFGSFRRALWKAVAKDQDLSQQFMPNDLDLMNKGYAPFVRKGERAGKRAKIELHHKKSISEGGDVYNVDNLNAVTPKRHVEIHKGE